MPLVANPAGQPDVIDEPTASGHARRGSSSSPLTSLKLAIPVGSSHDGADIHVGGSVSGCAFTRCARAILGRCLVLREVFSGNRRFDGIKAGLGITDTVLSNRLQRLVDEGLLDRSPYGGTGPAASRIRPHRGRRGHLARAACVGAVGQTSHHVTCARWWDLACGVSGVWATVGERRLVHHLRGATQSRSDRLAPCE